MLLAGTKKGYHKDVYSEHYVPVEEVQDELSFSIYKEMDWEQILLQKQEYLTKKAASFGMPAWTHFYRGLTDIHWHRNTRMNLA